MISISTFMKISKDGFSSEEISAEFMEIYEVQELAQQYAESSKENNVLKVDDYEITFYCFEAEVDFAKFLVSNGVLPGFVYVGTVCCAYLQYQDLMYKNDKMQLIAYDQFGTDVTDTVTSNMDNIVTSFELDGDMNLIVNVDIPEEVEEDVILEDEFNIDYEDEEESVGAVC